MGYYDLFAQALLAGQLHLLYTPEQVNLVDMIPYQDVWHFNWGPFPVLFHLVARQFGATLSDRVACLAAGTVSAWFFLSICAELRHRYFPVSPKLLVLWFALAFALGTPALLTACRGTVYSESIGFGVAAILFSLWSFLGVVRKPSPAQIALCGLGVGLAILTRITLSVYAFALFIGIGAAVWNMRHETKATVFALIVFSAPVLTGGFAQAAFNQARFGSPFDFGNRYKPEHTPGYPLLSLPRVPETVRHYFLALPQVSSDFPYLDHVGWPPVDKVRRAEAASSLILASPFLLFAAFAAPLFRGKNGTDPELRLYAWVLLGGGLLSLLAMLTFGAVSRRYAQDFLPPFVLLAFLGSALKIGGADSWRRWAMAAWPVLIVSTLLHMQIVFYQSFHTPTPDLNVIKTFVALAPLAQSVAPGPRLNEEASVAANDLGTVLLNQRRFGEALPYFEKAAEWNPGSDRIKRNLSTARRLAGQ